MKGIKIIIIGALVAMAAIMEAQAQNTYVTYSYSNSYYDYYDIPHYVRHTVARQYPGFELLHVNKFYRNHHRHYSLVLHRNGVYMEVNLGRKGRFYNHATFWDFHSHNHYFTVRHPHYNTYVKTYYNGHNHYYGHHHKKVHHKKPNNHYNNKYIEVTHVEGDSKPNRPQRQKYTNKQRSSSSATTNGRKKSTEIKRRDRSENQPVARGSNIVRRR